MSNGARAWGHEGRYYAHRPGERSADSGRGTSSDAKRWAQLLEAAAPGTYDSVSRAFKQWNNIIRDHLRTETGLRLSVGDDAQSVPVRITDGVPKPLAEVLQEMPEDVAWLILHRPEDPSCPVLRAQAPSKKSARPPKRGYA